MSATLTISPPASRSPSAPSAPSPPPAVELPDWHASTGLPAPDTIMIEASRLADESAPEGGYGWVVVAAASVLTFLFVGTTYSWGVIQQALV